MKHSLLQWHREERGVALVLTLAILVLVTLLVVAFAINMRVGSTASRAYVDQVRARQLAMAAVDEAVAKLRLATPKIGSLPTRMITNYVTMPGLVIAMTNGQPLIVPLCSTSRVDVLTGDDYQDMNFGSRHLINHRHDSHFRLMAQWYNWALPNNPRSGLTNLIGRYAYWVDDEASKLNIQVARQRPSGTEITTFLPQDLDIRALGGGIDPAISYDYAQSVGYLSPHSWWVSGAFNNCTYPALVCATNFFRTTVWSADMPLTPWGTPRFNLNTNLIANAAAYVNAVAAQLTNAHLNLWFGQNFRHKYGDNLRQIAANIRDYIDADNDPTDSGGDPPLYLGLEKTPYLNELVISNYFRVTTNALNQLVIEHWDTTLVELWYMYPPGSPDYDLSGHTITLRNRPSLSTPVGNMDLISPITMNLSGTITPAPWAGRFVVFAHHEPHTNVVQTPPGAPNLPITFNSGTVTAEFRGPGGRLDYAQIRLTNHTFMVTRAMLGQTIGRPWISACRDPRVRPVNNYWNPVGGGATFGTTTLGAWNSGSVGYWTTNTAPGATVLLPSDGQMLNRTTEFSCHTNISNRGTLASVGELGWIHTGVPWRTLALRPQDPVFERPAGAIPDWVVLDLFCTHPTNMPGRININCRVFASNEVQSASSAIRRPVLQALFYAWFNRLDAQSSLISSNIQNCYWNDYNGYYPPHSWHPFTNVYLMIGQICEVRGVTSNATAQTPGVTKELSERGIRAIANLITTRSNAFSIWAVGQSIADVNKNGRFDPSVDEILAEVIVQAVVERYEDPLAPPANRVKFRTRYVHYYTE